MVSEGTRVGEGQLLHLIANGFDDFGVTRSKLNAYPMFQPLPCTSRSRWGRAGARFNHVDEVLRTPRPSTYTSNCSTT